MRNTVYYSLVVVLMLTFMPSQQTSAQDPDLNNNKFKQLKTELATPNMYRNGAGKPGHGYWQQRADYDMQITLDDKQQRIYGEETVTYYNNSPDDLAYLWLQLDQNMRAKDSDSHKINTSKIGDRMSKNRYQMPWLYDDFDGGFKIDHVKSGDDKDLSYTINKTMMRIDLPEVLEAGKQVVFKVKWWYNINDRMEIGGRSGYEYFEEDKNYLYTIAQFFPRMCVYDDVEGWQNKQFLGRGEFALTFGDYKVAITVPSDHIIGATGMCSNIEEVLTKKQFERYEEAFEETKDPVIIVTQEEAERAEKSKTKDTKTWVFEAENVRDFGFASSRKFIWDGMGVKMGDRTVLAQSFYPKEGNPLWEQYSTKAVAHTLEIYSKHTFDYPYPQATSVHAAAIGMEYPMICFNFGRPEADGTYSARTKYGMISVIIHEVGHNYFPMIVSSDERQWTWMDEGLNSFLQFLAEQEWQRDYPSRRGPARNIVNYMKGDKDRISPIMTNSESIHQFGNNAYGKPATALNILRETIMGRELFDFAFKHYSQSWMFKHPTPADFFRVMEDASSVDLDWFWRGWFFTNEHCDIALSDVKWYQVDTKDPNVEKSLARKMEAKEPTDLTIERNRKAIPQTYVERDAGLVDFYNKYDEFDVDAIDKEEYKKSIKRMTTAEKNILKSDKEYYELTFENVGGLIMPVILQFEYVDGSTEEHHIPAEIWKLHEDKVTKVFVTNKEVISITLDPYLETADTDVNNNYWPPREQPTRFQLYKGGSRRYGSGENPMQRANRAKNGGSN